MALWIKKDDYIYPENNDGVRVYDKDETQNPALLIDQIVRPTGDRDAGINVKLRKRGDGLSGNGMILSYFET